MVEKVMVMLRDSLDALFTLDAALASDAGQQTGEWLHQFTNGNFTLLTAPHQEATEKEFKKEITKKKGRARSA